jgi:alpha-maltose-1-phosphate synthase
MHERHDRCVLVSQPVHQHAYEAAVAAQQAGLLCCFVTGLYWRDTTAWQWLPGPARRRVERELSRRRHPELDPTAVHTIPVQQLVAVALRRGLADVPGLRNLRPDPWAHRHFDAVLARRLARIEGVRLVHAFEGTARATFVAARRLGLATVLDVASARERYHAVEVEEGGSRRSWPMARVAAERRHADYLLAPSGYVVACLLEAGVPADRIVQLPYGAEPSRCPPPAPRAAGEPFRVLFVGQIGLRKGVRYLLEAWRRLRLRDAELVLVGAAGAQGRRLLRDYRGCHRWLGPLPRQAVRGWFQRSDVFAFPSLAEGSALVTYEAMSSALPLVVTQASGSVVRDGVDGFLVPPRDVDALADRLRHLYEHRDLGARMGAAASARIRERYTWRHYRLRLAGVYEAILSGRDPRDAVGASDRRPARLGGAG